MCSLCVLKLVHQALKTIAKSDVKMRVSDSLYFPRTFDQKCRSGGGGDHIHIYIYIYIYIYRERERERERERGREIQIDRAHPEVGVCPYTGVWRVPFAHAPQIEIPHAIVNITIGCSVVAADLMLYTLYAICFMIYAPYVVLYDMRHYVFKTPCVSIVCCIHFRQRLAAGRLDEAALSERSGR